MNSKPELKKTTNYDLFDMHEFNRPLHDNPVLLESMRTYGFMPSSPIHCKVNGNGKLKIIRGHHRYNYAKKLRLPVFYVVDDTNCDIFDLEGGTGQNWSVIDFATARARAGDRECATVLAFKKKHHLTVGATAALLAGQRSLKGNRMKQIKAGTFKVGDMRHAHAVVAITDLCRECGVSFATSSAFVGAVSMALGLPEFDSARFCHCVKMYGANLHKRGTVVEYLEEIEALYNYQAKAKRIPLKFQAVEAARKRQETFGKSAA